MTRLLAITFTTLLILSVPLPAISQERLCDTQHEDCRAAVLELIRNERVGLDVAFWYMEDSRYSNEIVARFKAGLPVRVLCDSRANKRYRMNPTILAQLAEAGIPMREKFGADVLHFKMMLFHGQDVVQFSKANYNAWALSPIEPNVSYDDEVVFFTSDDNITNSFRRRFDDRWLDTSEFRNYANISGPLVRTYPLHPVHSSMNFPPVQNFSTRSVSRYDREMDRIDAIVFRATDHRQADAMIRAVQRGVHVRLITEPDEYRNPDRVWDSKHKDRMWMGGVDMKIRRHQGLMHQASVIMYGLGEVIFGSSNWTTASALYQDEHNYFYNPSLGKPWLFQWFVDQFERKWNDPVNYGPFTPLPPDPPTYSSPVNGASGVGSSVTLNWDGGPWGHLYDIYLGTTPEPPLLAGNVELGSPLAGQRETYTVNNLLPGTTYYWRIVGKTWAQLGKSGPTWSFTTAGTAPAGGAGGGGGAAYGGTPPAVPGIFQAENFDEGGQGQAYSDTTVGNAGGAYRPTDVDLQPAADTGGGNNVGWTQAGEWMKYTVNVTSTGTYTLEARVASIGTGATFRVEVDGVDRTGAIALPNTGGWQMWRTITKAGIPLTAGERVIRVVFTSVDSSGAAGNYNWFRFVGASTASPPPPSTSPYGGIAVALPGTVQAENFDVGAQGVAYFDASAGNSGGAYRTTDVDLAPTADPSNGGFHLGWARVGEWLKYTVNVAETRNYTLNVRLANVGSGGSFRIEVDGVDRTGPIAVPNTGGWDIWQTVSITGIPLTQGTRVLRVVMLTRNAENSSVGNFGYFTFQ